MRELMRPFCSSAQFKRRCAARPLLRSGRAGPPGCARARRRVRPGAPGTAERSRLAQATLREVGRAENRRAIASRSAALREVCALRTQSDCVWLSPPCARSRAANGRVIALRSGYLARGRARREPPSDRAWLRPPCAGGRREQPSHCVALRLSRARSCAPGTPERSRLAQATLRRPWPPSSAHIRSSARVTASNRKSVSAGSMIRGGQNEMTSPSGLRMTP